MANPVAGIDIVARLDKFREELAKIPDIGGAQAKALASQMSKEIKAAERAAQQAAKASREAAGATKDFGDKAGKTGEAAGKLAGALGLVDERGAEAARTVADIADVAEVANVASQALGVSLGTLGLAVGGVTALVGLGYVAWKAYKAEEEEVERKSDQLAASLKQLQPIHDLAASSALELAHATGKLSDEEYAYQQGLQSAKAARDQVTSATKEQIAADRKALDALGATARTLDGKLVPSAQKLTDKIAEGTAVLDAADEAYTSVEASLRAVRDATIAHESAEEQAKRETLERKYAEEAFTAAVHELIDAEQKAWALEKERAKTLAANAKIIADAEERSADRRAEAAASAAQRTMKAEQDLADQMKKAAEDKRELLLGYASELLADVDPFVEAFGNITDAMLETRTDALDEVRGQIEDLDALLGDLSADTVDAATLSGQALVDAYKAGEVAAADLTDAQRAALESQLTAERDALAQKEAIEHDAAEKAFEVQQGVAIAGTLMSGLQAALTALAQLGPVAGGIAATGIAALAATNAGLIANTKPQFHAGGVRGGTYPDEVASVTLPGEGWANRQAMNDPANRAALNAMNAGQSVGSGVTVLRIGRHEAREIARTDIRANGIIPQEMRRVARRSGSGAGLAGGGVVA